MSGQSFWFYLAPKTNTPDIMKFKPGVLTGDEVTEVFNDAMANQYALPAVNVIGTNSVNAVLETARDINSPCLLYTSPSPRDRQKSRMPSSA